MSQLESETALTIIHQICKIFYVSNQLYLLPFLKENNGLAPWIQTFKILIDMPVPEQLESATDDIEVIANRDKSVLWKLKA